MAFEPESVLGPSFQMSFAAVAALIALYERTGTVAAAGEAGLLPSSAGPGGLGPAVAPRTGWSGRIARAVMGTAAATLVAEAATAPSTKAEPIGTLPSFGNQAEGARPASQADARLKAIARNAEPPA
jgi:hypothetical protein